MARILECLDKRGYGSYLFIVILLLIELCENVMGGNVVIDWIFLVKLALLILAFTWDNKGMEKVFKLSYIDNLTGVYNRNYLSLLLNSYKGCKYVCFIDMDNFKEINDTYGHSVGDKVLRVISRRIKEEAVGGVVIRFGGDEFLVVGKGDLEEKFLEEIIERVRKPIYVGESVCTVGCSIGAVYDCSGNMLIGDVLDMADGLMYKAKKKTEDKYYLKRIGEGSSGNT